MNTLVNEKSVEPVGVEVSKKVLAIELADGRSVSAPAQWFPRVARGTPKEWANFELLFSGVHWPDLNEDISIEGLLRGEKSGESPASIERWLKYRALEKKEPVTELPPDPKLTREFERVGVLKSMRTSDTTRRKTKPSRLHTLNPTR